MHCPVASLRPVRAKRRTGCAQVALLAVASVQIEARRYFALADSDIDQMGLFSKAKKGLQPSSDQRGANDDALGGNAGRNTSTPDLDGAEGQAQQQYSQPDSQAPPQSQDKRAGKGLFGGRMRRRASSAAADDQSAAIPQQQQPYQAGRPISRSQMTKTAIVQDVIGQRLGVVRPDLMGADCGHVIRRTLLRTARRRLERRPGPRRHAIQQCGCLKGGCRVRRRGCGRMPAKSSG